MNSFNTPGVLLYISTKRDSLMTTIAGTNIHPGVFLKRAAGEDPMAATVPTGMRVKRTATPPPSPRALVAMPVVVIAAPIGSFAAGAAIVGRRRRALPGAYHLTASQRAEAVVAARGWRPLGANQHGGSIAAMDPTTAEMAKEAEVGTATIERAKAAHKAGLGNAVRDGKVSAQHAIKKSRSIAAIDRTTAEMAKERTTAGDKSSTRPEVVRHDFGVRC